MCLLPVLKHSFLTLNDGNKELKGQAKFNSS